jgi:septal ring factor EnvC (AmiA/AmiB activator)
MATTDERVSKLEVRVDVLETWAGPGQTGALADGQRKIRADLAKIVRTQDRHGRLLGQLTSDVDVLKTDVAQLKTDVAQLRSDMTGVKATLGEILRRLPAKRD